MTHDTVDCMPDVGAEIRGASERVAKARADLLIAEAARDQAVRDAIAAGMTGAAVAAATKGTGAEIREMRVSQIRRGVR